MAYIGTLPDAPAARTLTIDAGNGQRLYGTCAACHGADGRGIQAMNAPRLAGMSDWYLASQLNNFKHGIRGANQKDLYGPQMVSMAAILTDDKAVNEVAAYLNGLR